MVDGPKVNRYLFRVEALAELIRFSPSIADQGFGRYSVGSH